MGIVGRFVGWMLVAGLTACSAAAPPNNVDGGPDPIDGEGSSGKEKHDPLRGEIELERYPRMVMPGEVVKAQPTTVFVGLRDTPGETGAAVVLEGPSGGGQQSLKLKLPKLQDGERAWDIDVILSAPDFTITGDDLQTIQLPEKGPSTMARYTVTLDEVPASGTADVQAYLFHDGAFMGHIGRTVDAVAAPSERPNPDTDLTATSSTAPPPSASHELHLLALDDTQALVVINEPGKTMAHAVVPFERASLPAFLGPKLTAIRSRGLDRVGGDAVGMDMVRGLGTQLWPLVPAPIRAHLLAIHDDADVEALRIYTNVPGFPWELVRPVKDDGQALDALGVRYELGRWHLRMGMTGMTVPPTRIDYRELVAMFPRYGGEETLPAVQRELKALEAVRGFRRVPGVAASVAQIVRDPPNGVVHFAGHGDAAETEGASTRFALRLEDGDFDSTAFVGIDGKRLRERQTLVFFNACELGQADTTANIVEGWAPVMLDAGASGYIGALWPIGDDEAAAFAEAFYDEVERSIARLGQAQVTSILRCLRSRGAAKDDPTWQAYVFYGDPSTALTREGVTPTEPGGTYSCE